MLVNCTNCNKEVDKKTSQVKRSENHFCSRKCKDEWQKGKSNRVSNKIKHKCNFCDKEILVENYKYQFYLKGEIKNLFCDKHCLSNWQKINFKGENSSVYNSVNKNCDHCGKEYTAVRSREDTSKFCSVECASESRITDCLINCDCCNKEFTKKPNCIRNHNFCSRECSEKWTSENKNIQVTKVCLICQKEYKVANAYSEKSKTCSRECHNLWLKEYYFKSEKGRQHLISNGIKSLESKKYSETKPERIVREYLDKNNITYIPQHFMYDKFVVDFYLPEKDIVLEVFGDYWHGNPIFYGLNNNLKPLTEKQIKQKNKDKSRDAYLSKCGHKFAIIWENDVYYNLNNKMKELI